MNKQRVVFVNLHGNEFLVKTLNKYIFKQSVAIKHKYLLDYMLKHPDIQVCSYINPKGFSLALSLPKPIMVILNLFRFMEHRIVMRKNGIPLKSIKIIRRAKEIQPDDIVIAYRHCPSSLYNLGDIKAFKAISMIHFGGRKDESTMLEEINPDVLFNESDLSRHSEIFQRYYCWYKKEMIVHPFVFAERFQKIKPFSERKNMAFATGTITYKTHPEFLEVYGNSCDQPTRKQIKDNQEELKDLVYCTSSDFSETTKSIKTRHDNAVAHLYKAFHYKMFESQQKSYYSFDMVKSFNNYKMCIVGEEVLGIPGIGFVEGMACGCAFIGQIKGYYEDYGMIEGVHYIGYDGTLEDLKTKISYYQRPEHQKELEDIANKGYLFAKENFNGNTVAERLLRLIRNY